MAQADNISNTSTILKHLSPHGGIFYAMSEEAQLELRHLRDGLGAVASLVGGETGEDDIPGGLTGRELRALFRVFALAADTVVAMTPVRTVKAH